MILHTDDIPVPDPTMVRVHGDLIARAIAVLEACPRGSQLGGDCPTLVCPACRALTTEDGIGNHASRCVPLRAMAQGVVA